MTNPEKVYDFLKKNIGICPATSLRAVSFWPNVVLPNLEMVAGGRNVLQIPPVAFSIEVHRLAA